MKISLVIGILAVILKPMLPSGVSVEHFDLVTKTTFQSFGYPFRATVPLTDKVNTFNRVLLRLFLYGDRIVFRARPTLISNLGPPCEFSI
mmetsp:Transcript_16097/g.29023  ORF Transcript_16097/g.29023 Transcript_16097/m.29023 type:complete len:90 (-) Transcript_16097:343-612(-)